RGRRHRLRGGARRDRFSHRRPSGRPARGDCGRAGEEENLFLAQTGSAPRGRKGLRGGAHPGRLRAPQGHPAAAPARIADREAGGMNVAADLELWHLVANASLVVKAVMGLLLAVSFMSWMFIFRKWFSIARARTQTEEFE